MDYEARHNTINRIQKEKAELKLLEKEPKEFQQKQYIKETKAYIKMLEEIISA